MVLVSHRNSDSRTQPNHDEEIDMTTTDTRQNSISALCEALGVPPARLAAVRALGYRPLH